VYNHLGVTALARVQPYSTQKPGSYDLGFLCF